MPPVIIRDAAELSEGIDTAEALHLAGLSSAIPYTDPAVAEPDAIADADTKPPKPLQPDINARNAPTAKGIAGAMPRATNHPR